MWFKLSTANGTQHTSEDIITFVRRERARACSAWRHSTVSRHTLHLPPSRGFHSFGDSVINKPCRCLLVRHGASLTSQTGIESYLHASLFIIDTAQVRISGFPMFLKYRTRNISEFGPYDLGGLLLQMSAAAARTTAVLSHFRKWLKVPSCIMISRWVSTFSMWCDGRVNVCDCKVARIVIVCQRDVLHAIMDLKLVCVRAIMVYTYSTGGNIEVLLSVYYSECWPWLIRISHKYFFNQKNNFTCKPIFYAITTMILSNIYNII